MNPQEIYSEKINKYNTEIKVLKKKSARMSTLRFMEFLTGSIIIYFLFHNEFHFSAWTCILLFLSFFVYLVMKHDIIKKKLEIKEQLLEVNRKSFERIEDKWHRFHDSGEEYIDDKHPFSFDLDIFGKGSLFQWINCTGTFLGRNELIQRMTKQNKEKKEILKRQESIKELSANIDFRQKLQALGMLDKNLLNDPTPIINWAKDGNRVIKGKFARNIFKIISLAAFSTLVLYLFSDNFGISKTAEWFLRTILLLIIVLQITLLGKFFKRVHKIFDICITFKDNITTYKNLIQLIEKTNFSSEYLNKIKNNLVDSKGQYASERIKKLETIVDFIKLKFSNIYFLIDILTLWDFHCLIAIEKWKDKSGEDLSKWLIAIAQFEELSSFSILSFDNPSWIYPEIIDDNYNFHGKNLGHPLISSQKRVCNDFSLEGPESITIITGSNMSGKSTMLRTVGFNVMLSYTGAPVCADECRCSLMDIYTSMRIKDNLEENISTFYAELLRIKMVIEASEKNTILFLFDEILRGTNTRDRKIGVEAIIKQLGENRSMGIIATHDTDMAVSKKENRKINSFYFRETYDENKIFFDYKLYNGISNTSDAVYLMKMIGIKLDSI